MSIFARLFRASADPREAMRPLWHKVVEISRQEHWYEADGVADTVSGRFDMITAVLSLVLIRMEREEELIQPSVWLTELFVEDMEGQLRQSGVNDVVVGKRMGKLISVLGGRIGAYRDALTQDGEAALREAINRNVSLLDGHTAEPLANDLRALAARFDTVGSSALLAGDIAP